MKTILAALFLFSVSGLYAQTPNQRLSTTSPSNIKKQTINTHDGDAVPMLTSAKVDLLEKNVYELTQQVQTLQKQLQDMQVAMKTKLTTTDVYSATYTIDMTKDIIDNMKGVYDYTINDAAYTNNPKAIVAATIVNNKYNFPVASKTYFGKDNKWHVSMAKYIVNYSYPGLLKSCEGCANYPNPFEVAVVEDIAKSGPLTIDVRVINLK